MNNFGEKVAFIWSVADLLRDAFKRSKYPDVILPLTVLRRLDCVLEPSKERVLTTYAKLKGKLENLAPQLRKASGFAFYNTSPFTFERLLGDAPNLAAKQFDYLLANPPYGKEWKLDKDRVDAEARRGHAGRFGAGLPRISDGQLLFLQHMLNRMKDIKDGGSRAAIVMNDSPLFTGDAASGESEIRRWILENDWLETIVALPEQLFYNTGIPTYVWVLTNRKPKARKGKVQLIDATAIWTPMRKSLGDKRREIAPQQSDEITRIYEVFRESEQSRIFAITDFGYRKITVERPLRLNFQASPERIERLKQEKAFQKLAANETLLQALSSLDAEKVWTNREAFRKYLNGVKVPASFWKVLLSALSQRDETAEICFDADGDPEADPELRDTENVPLGEDVQTFFEREVKPHVPDAWINTAIRDHKDGAAGKVGYEINFNRYFYQYQPPRPLEEIEADIKALEKDIIAMLREVAG